MENPLEQPAPTDPLERVQTFARDLAWGVLHAEWPHDIIVHVRRDGSRTYQTREIRITFSTHKRFSQCLSEKWHGNPPDPDLLNSMRFLRLKSRTPDEIRGIIIEKYCLTKVAYDLLRKSVASPSVFISYRRESSSALGLLIVARLKAVGIPNPFIDIDIEGGDDWKKRIETMIRVSRNFVLLLAPETLKKSEWVHYEIKIALEMPDMAIIPIWHNGYSGEGMDTVIPGNRNAIHIAKESPDHYEMAIAKLLNKLGYTL
jgi:hypothetical protein